jgi:lipopolysaccharide biosynthesis glycosyltransferase
MRVYLGYDRREDIVFKVALHSLYTSTNGTVVMPLVQDELRALDLYWRPTDERGSTDFSLTRFLVPALTGYEGWALFADCDFLFTRDLRKALTPYVDQKKAAMVVKHDYVPRHSVKMDGKVQHVYPRKNWSSFMLVNCGHEANKVLTPSVVNSAPPAWLHQLAWLDDADIGALPLEFNFLVGEYEPPEDGAATIAEATTKTPACLHFTNGIGPFAPVTPDYTALWEAARGRYMTDRERAVYAAKH